MIQVYADDRLIFDTRLEDYTLLGLRITTGLNKSGTAEIIMPPGHPGYNAFTSYRTVATVYQDDVLLFRGRALYPEDDFYKRRAITCEGERGFFQDGVIRPYLYQDTPAAIFAHALSLYNEQVDDFKRFALGEVTVTDANNYVRLEKNSAETFAEFFDKMVERCGGYITFSTNAAGERCVNWLTEIGVRSGQAIEFGENMLDFTQSGETPDLATVLVPYGAQLEDGSRLTLSSVNGGKDYIEDAEAIALRGRIVATVTWDDVTVEANLLTKARQWLAEHRLAITSLKLSAVDLSRLDKTIDSYQDGDLVRVISRPHGVDDWFMLTERDQDLLDDQSGQITLGKTTTSLTGTDAAKEKSNAAAIDKVTVGYKTDIGALQQEAANAVIVASNASEAASQAAQAANNATAAANAAAQAAAAKLGPEDIANNLTTDDAAKVLAAAQGAVLKGMIYDAVDDLTVDAISNLELEKILK